MKDKKACLKFYSVVQWKEEEKFLTQQHKKGWEFTKVNAVGIYHFKKCTPDDVVYQLDYNPDAAKNKAEYVQMFNDCGWEYIQDYAGYSYFRKPISQMNGSEEIFCDDSSRLDFMKRVFKGRISLLLIIFFVTILPQIYIQSQSDDLFGRVLKGVFIVLGIIYLVIFLVFGVQYLKYIKLMK